MNNFTRIAAAALSFLVYAAPALAITYECRVTKSNANYIPEILVIEHDDKTGEVTVFDPVIKHFLDRPTNGEVAVDNAKRITFSWSINSIKADALQTANLRYRATVLKRSKKLSITGKPLGYENNFKGSGTCIVK